MTTRIDNGRAAHPWRETIEGRRAVAAVGVATAVTLALGLFRIGSRSFWIDEASTWSTVDRSLGELVDLVASREANGMLYHLALWPWRQLGDSEAWLRMPSVVFITATVPFVAAIGARVSRVVGVLAAFFFTFNGTVGYYSQEARTYALGILLATLSTWRLLHLMDDPTRRNAFGYGVCATLLVYSHLFAVFVVASHVVVVATHPERRRFGRTLLATWAWSALATVPLAVSFVRAWGLETDGVSELFELNPRRVASLAARLAGSGGPALLGVTMLLTLAALVGRGRARDGGTRTLTTTAALSWLIAPPLLLIAVSLVDPLFEFRYVVFSLPAVALSAAVGVCSLPGARLPRVAACVTGALLVASTIRHHTDETLFDWRTAVSTAVAAAQPGDRAMFLSTYDRLAGEYYVDRLGVQDGPLQPALPDVPWGAFSTGDHVSKPTEADEYREVAARATRVVLFVQPLDDDREQELQARIAEGLLPTHELQSTTTLDGGFELRTFTPRTG